MSRSSSRDSPPAALYPVLKGQTFQIVQTIRSKHLPHPVHPVEGILFIKDEQVCVSVNRGSIQISYRVQALARAGSVQHQVPGYHQNVIRSTLQIL